MVFAENVSFFPHPAHQSLAGDPVVTGLVSGWARVALYQGMCWILQHKVKSIKIIVFSRCR